MDVSHGFTGDIFWKASGIQKDRLVKDDLDEIGLAFCVPRCGLHDVVELSGVAHAYILPFSINTLQAAVGNEEAFLGPHQFVPVAMSLLGDYAMGAMRMRERRRRGYPEI